MSDISDPIGKTKRPTNRWRFTVVVLLVVVAVIVIMRVRKVDDSALEKALEGTWTAVDPSDASLHRRDQPVTHEQLIIGADKKLTHVVELASEPGNPENDLWAWKVSKGRLYVRYLGEDASGQWLPGFAFSISDKAMSIRTKGHPPKKWTRS